MGWCEFVYLNWGDDTFRGSSLAEKYANCIRYFKCVGKTDRQAIGLCNYIFFMRRGNRVSEAQ